MTSTIPLYRLVSRTRHVEFVALALGPADDAGLADDRPAVGDFEDAVAGDLQAGVDAEDAGGGEVGHERHSPSWYSNRWAPPGLEIVISPTAGSEVIFDATVPQIGHEPLEPQREVGQFSVAQSRNRLF